MSCGILMPKYVNNALLTYFIQYKKLAWGGRIVHSLSSGKVEMFLCAACHAFTPHVNAWKR